MFTARLLAIPIAVSLLVGFAPSAVEAKTGTSKSVTGQRGEVLTVSATRGLAKGQTILLSGNRFDETVGIYVAVCVTPKPGQVPSPCGGGADQSGSLGASQWISSNPPPYGEGLAIPFKAGGRFSVKIKVAPKIGTKDCRKISCAVVVRADHTRSDDRTHDLVVPLTFKK